MSSSSSTDKSHRKHARDEYASGRLLPLGPPPELNYATHRKVLERKHASMADSPRITRAASKTPSDQAYQSSMPPDASPPYASSQTPASPASHRSMNIYAAHSATLPTTPIYEQWYSCDHRGSSKPRRDHQDRDSSHRTPPPPSVSHAPPASNLPVPEQSFPISTISSSAAASSRYHFWVVTVGRRTGVFDNWLYVSALIKGIPNATYKGYTTLEEATKSYNDIKRLGLIDVVRSTGDEALYGPLDEAVQ